MPKGKITDKKLIDVCRDLVSCDEYQKDIANRHGLDPNYLARLKKTERFKTIYQQVLSAEISKGV